MKKRYYRIIAAAVGFSCFMTGCCMDPVKMAEVSHVLAGKAAARPDVEEDCVNDIMYEITDEGFYAEEPAEEAWVQGVPVWNTEEYKYNPENRWVSVKTSPFSTFAADVDTASYANLRRLLKQGGDIPADAVRIEEMINYFQYHYEEPAGDSPFSVTTHLAPCPWNENTDLLLIGLQAGKKEMERIPSNLVFLIDVSGSMDEPDKLPLVQRAFRLLAEQMTEQDRVSVVTYANGDEVVLEGVRGDEHARITEAMEDLSADGWTDGSAGIQAAYELAEKYYIRGGNNRVILATDGDLNVGITDEGSLVRLITEKAESGVFLSVLGFGSGNISDTNMEALADHGNGNYSFIDEIGEARKVLVQEAGGTLLTVAKDVKLQVEFNPEAVKGYRLIGYENRTMAAEDFSDDSRDGGEIGSGHQMTALYEIARIGSAQEIPEVVSRYGEGEDSALEASEWLTLNIRYKEPEEEESRLLVYPVGRENWSSSMGEDMSWAAGVAQVGMILRNSEFSGTTDLEEVKNRLRKISPSYNDSYRDEFLYLISRIQENERNG